VALGIIPGDPDSAVIAFVDLKIELHKEKATRIAGQIEIDMVTQEVKDLKIYTDRFAS
jgi:activator of HSP90 ATPase